MENEIAELLRISLKHPGDIEGFYSSFRDWLKQTIDREILIFYQPSPLENLPYKENHKANPNLLHGDAHPPGDIEVSALQFRDQGLCSDSFFLQQIQTKETWFGALEGSGNVPELLQNYSDLISDLFKINVMIEDYSLGDTVSENLLLLFNAVNESETFEDASTAILDILGDALDCRELGYYQKDENHYQLRAKLGFDTEDNPERQFYPRDQLRELGMGDSYYALEPSDESNRNHLFLPLNTTETQVGLITAYETPFSMGNLTETEKVKIKMLNITSTLIFSLVKVNFNQERRKIWDSITDLKTEEFFSARLEEEVERGDRYGYTFSLLLFEVEEINRIQEEFGASILKELLRKLSHNVNTIFRVIDTACRFENHQFGVLFPNTEPEGAVRAGERFIEMIDEPFFTIGEREISIRLDGGIAKYPEDGGTPEELLKQARLALYEAKQNEQPLIKSSQELTET